jgi:hypothetical protein
MLVIVLLPVMNYSVIDHLEGELEPAQWFILALIDIKALITIVLFTHVYLLNLKQTNEKLYHSSSGPEMG